MVHENKNAQNEGETMKTGKANQLEGKPSPNLDNFMVKTTSKEEQHMTDGYA